MTDAEVLRTIKAARTLVDANNSLSASASGQAQRSINRANALVLLDEVVAALDGEV